MTEHEADWVSIESTSDGGILGEVHLKDQIMLFAKALLELRERVEALEEDPEPECGHRWRHKVLPVRPPIRERKCRDCGRVERNYPPAHPKASPNNNWQLYSEANE